MPSLSSKIRGLLLRYSKKAYFVLNCAQQAWFIPSRLATFVENCEDLQNDVNDINNGRLQDNYTFMIYSDKILVVGELRRQVTGTRKQNE